VSAPPLRLRHEFLRKALHLSVGLFPVAYAIGAPRRVLEAVLALMSALALLIELVRRLDASIGARVNGAFGAFMREHERTSITGATWLSLSCLGAVFLLSREAAIAALWCVTVGDPAAAIAGLWWTARRRPHPDKQGGKTIAGTLACGTVSFAGVWMLAGYPPAAAAIIAAAGAAAEAAPWSLDDNLSVAGVAGAAAQLLA
jgi:dolichol kinase